MTPQYGQARPFEWTVLGATVGLERANSPTSAFRRRKAG